MRFERLGRRLAIAAPCWRRSAVRRGASPQAAAALRARYASGRAALRRRVVRWRREASRAGGFLHQGPRVRRAEQREAEFSTISGHPIEPLYTARGRPGTRGAIGHPGEYPFTRGPYPSMYRGRLWTMRQFAGFGTVEETNERFHYLLDHGQTGLSTAFDMPTLMGYDSDHARSLGEVGREGVAVDTLDDMEQLFEGSRSAGSPPR